MKFCEATLSNGLEVIAECNPDAYASAFGFFVKTGARDETPEVAGVSHFGDTLQYVVRNKFRDVIVLLPRGKAPSLLPGDPVWPGAWSRRTGRPGWRPPRRRRGRPAPAGCPTGSTC